jgi:hypothetical protein
VYSEPSPWLLVIPSGDLVGLPTKQLGERPLIQLADRPGDSPLEFFSGIHWSPDGNLAVLYVDLEQFGCRYEYLRFDHGLPSEASLLPDVPNWSSGCRAPEFSKDSRFTSVNDPATGTYLLDFQRPEIATYFVPLVDGVDSDLEFCAVSSSWLRWALPEGESVGPTWRAALDGETIKESRLDDYGWASASPNGELVTFDRGISSEGLWLGFVLAPCATDDWSVEFANSGYWGFSPDSSFLWAEVEPNYERVLYSLAEPSEPERLFADSDLGCELTSSFTPDSRYGIASMDGLHYLVDTRGGKSQTPSPLRLPQQATLAALRNRALLAWSAEGSTLLWQAVPASRAAVPVLDATSNSTLFDDAVDPERVWLVRRDAGKSELFSIILDGMPPVPRLQLEVDGELENVVLAPDASGLAFSLRSEDASPGLYWAALDASGALSERILLATTFVTFGFQPWP